MKTTKQKNQKILSLFLGLVLVLSSLPYLALAAASFDTSYYPVLQVSNYTNCPGCRDWSKSTSALSGETVSFLIYYYNTSQETAQNVKVRLFLPSQRKTTQTVTGDIFANNANQVYGSATINLNEAQTLTLLSGNVYWYPNGSSGTALPNGQSGNEIITQAGLSLGNIPARTAGYVVARARVSDYKTPEIISQNFNPNILREDEMNLKAQIDPKGADTDAWFEWGKTSGSLLEKTSIRTVLGGNTGNLDETIYDLLPETTYYFRAVAKNEVGTVYGPTISFTTLASCKPEIKTFAASDLTNNSAVLWAEVSPHGLNTTAYFEWGTSFSSLTSQTPSSSYTGETVKSFNYHLINLNPNTIYYFRAVASNYRGKFYGETKSFVTTSQDSQPQEQAQPQSQPQSQPSQPSSQTSQQTQTKTTTTTSQPKSQPIQTKIVYVSTPKSTPQPAAPTAPTCNCSEWQKAGCGEGGCQGYERLEKRTCDPQGCDKETRCTVDTQCSKISKVMFLGAYIAPSGAQPGEIIDYKINYRNDTGAVVTKAILNLTIPEGAIFQKFTATSAVIKGKVESSLTSRVEGLTLDLGDLAKDEEGEIMVKIMIDEKAVPGTGLNFPVQLSYNDPQITVFSTETITTKKGGAVAGLVGGLGSVVGIPLWIILIVFFAIVASLAYLKKDKEKNIPFPQSNGKSNGNGKTNGLIKNGLTQQKSEISNPNLAPKSAVE